LRRSIHINVTYKCYTKRRQHTGKIHTEHEEQGKNPHCSREEKAEEEEMQADRASTKKSSNNKEMWLHRMVEKENGKATKPRSAGRETPHIYRREGREKETGKVIYTHRPYITRHSI
jgi:hypothetical protein